MTSLLLCRLGTGLRSLGKLGPVIPLQIKSIKLAPFHSSFRPQTTGRLPFEPNEQVLKDTLVFSYKNDSLYRMISIFGIVQFFFWFHLGVFAYSDIKKVEKPENEDLFDKETFWGKVLQVQAKAKDKLAFLSMGIAYAVLFFTFMYPQRTIKRLTLLKGGTKVKVTTYTHMGREKNLTLPLNHINCMQARSKAGAQIALKIKDYRLYFLMDKNKGTFHDTNLFDYVIGLKRNLK